jgi:glycosyltransferase involved in cell wall biosynthesis
VTTISAVIPVYNGRARLRGAVESVLRQTQLPAELVIVDDGSSDGSLEALEGLAMPFPLRLERQANAGQSVARNRGVALSSGERIAFLDQDDEWLPRHLELLSAALDDDPEAGWAYSDFDEIDGAGAVVTRRFLRAFGVRHPKLSLADCVGADLMVLPSASLLRRSTFEQVGGFDESLSGYEDDDLFVRVFRAGWNHAFVDRALVRFRIHGKSSSTSASFLRSRLLYAEKLRRSLPDDARLGRYYLRDHVAPRFFFNTLDDYVRACSARDWQQAARTLDALERFLAWREPGVRLRLKVLGIRSPRLFRRLMAWNERLPPLLRWTRNPLIHLRREVPPPVADEGK